MSVWIAGATALAGPATADPDAMFEPEVARLTPSPGPYEAALRTTLLDDAPASCQLMVQPSFAPEWSVFVVEPQKNHFEVVHRRYDAQLWASMSRALEPTTKSREPKLVPPAPTAKEVRAAIDAPTARRLFDICARIVRSVRPIEPTATTQMDGVAYHVAHWIAGQRLAGIAHSPPPDSTAGMFIDFQTAVAAYAAAKPEDQAHTRKELLGFTRRLARHLGKVEKKAKAAAKKGKAGPPS